MSNNSQESHRSFTDAASRIAFASAALIGQYAPNHGQSSLDNTPAVAASASPEVAGLLPAETTSKDAESTPEAAPESSTFRQYLNQNTVYINGSDCTGMLIHEDGDVNKPAVAVASAAHCGYLKDMPSNIYWYGTTYQEGSDGQTYTVKPSQIAEIGKSSDDLTPVGQISQVVLSSNASENDQLLGVLPGYTAEQAIEGYRQELITAAEVNALIPGKTKGILRGWPVNQTESQPDVMTTQEFPMTYVGRLNVAMKSEQNLEVSVWAIKDDKDNAICSFGDSGGQGVTEINGQPVLLGPESVFWPFVKLTGYVSPTDFNNDNNYPSSGLEAMKEAFPDFDWKGTSAACGFNWVSPESTQTVNVVPNSSDIPGEEYSAIDRPIYETELQFANPNIPRTVVNGTVLVNVLDKGGGTGLPGIAVNNPIISQGPDNSLNVGYYVPTLPGEIEVVNAPISDIVFYQNSPNTALNTFVSKGPISYPSSAAAEAVKTIGITLNNGEMVGTQIDPGSLTGLSPDYSLQVVGNQYNFVPVNEPTPTNPSS